MRLFINSRVFFFNVGMLVEFSSFILEGPILFVLFDPVSVSF